MITSSCINYESALRGDFDYFKYFERTRNISKIFSHSSLIETIAAIIKAAFAVFIDVLSIPAIFLRNLFVYPLLLIGNWHCAERAWIPCDLVREN